MMGSHFWVEVGVYDLGGGREGGLALSSSASKIQGRDIDTRAGLCYIPCRCLLQGTGTGVRQAENKAERRGDRGERRCRA